MNTDFRRLLDDATQLTRQGNAAEATRLIQKALGTGGGAGPAENGDAPRREDETGTAGRRAAAPPAGGAGGAIIDGEWSRADGTGGKGDGAGGTSAGAAPAGRDRAADAADEIVRSRHEGGAGALDYRLFVPASAAGVDAPALVVMLHGCTQGAEDFATGTRMDALASEHGFLVLYPEQSGKANPQRCWNWFKDVHQRRGRGEPAMIEEMVRSIVEARGVDPARVFVAGLSAGGAMAAILGNVYPDRFAAVGVHSGLAAGAAQDLPGAMAAMRGGQGGGGLGGGGLGGGLGDFSGLPGMGGAGPVPVRASAAGPATRQPPTIVFHGDADHTVHPDNGERVAAVCLDGLSTASEAVRAPERDSGKTGGRGWSRVVHRDAAGEPVVERWTVHGAGHAWSGGNPRGSYTAADGPDASAEMVRFFLGARGA